jgi:hypothetical protein
MRMIDIPRQSLDDSAGRIKRFALLPMLINSLLSSSFSVPGFVFDDSLGGGAKFYGPAF